jgi:hypothetical protein
MDCSRPQRNLILLACLAMLVSTSCFVRRRSATPPGAKPETRPLLTATREELIERVHKVSDAIRYFTMTADISSSVGRLYNGEVTDYATIRCYLLFQKPADIRIIGLDPVIHTRAFDMVSTGGEFRVYIPSRNRFIEGRNDTPATSKSKLENLRPSAFLDSLMVIPPEPATDAILLEEDTNATRAYYILRIIRRDSEELRLVRSIYFDRYTLQIVRQKTFNDSGTVISDTRYSDWKEFAGIAFPAQIDIQRPLDGYEVVLNVVELKINGEALTPDKFVLAQPAGSQLEVLK